MSLNNTVREYFKNNKHTFVATINQQTNTIRIGGKKYNACINISINTITNKGKISHIQYEPECSFYNILEKGDTVDFVKASLQYVHMKYPSITIFDLEDMSNIDCGKTKGNSPPRKLEKPFSLAHLSIALKGKTWYEEHFNAKMVIMSGAYKADRYDKYRDSIDNLKSKINLDYNTFKQENYINSTQDAILSKYYDPAIRWKDFFNRIPKAERCGALFNWLPIFIERILGGTYSQYGWYIDINIMEKTEMELTNTPSERGGYKTRKQRLYRQSRITFSNTFPYYGGGIELI